ncbi:MAG: AMP-binding protein [Acidobacteriota bacterium]
MQQEAGVDGIDEMSDYDEVRSSFQLQAPERFNFAGDVLDRWAEEPTKLAIWWVDDAGHEVKRTFAELCVESRKLCNALAEKGVKRGDVVVVILPRLIEWWVINIACLRMGAVISPGTTQLKAKDIRYRLLAAEAACIITDAEVAPRVDEVIESCPGIRCRILVEPEVAGGSQQGDARQVDGSSAGTAAAGGDTGGATCQTDAAAGGDAAGEVDAGWHSYHELLAAASDEFETADTGSDEGAILYFTSGTTGYPKMTLHTHASYPLGHKITGKFWLDLGEDDLHWNVSDTGWAKAAWSSLFGPWNMGAAVFVHRSPRFDPTKTLQVLASYPITTLCAAPTVYRMLVLEDLTTCGFPSLRHCVAAGEPLNPEVIEVWRQATGITIRDGYGQTESVLLVGSFPFIEARAGSMGKPAPGFEVGVIDEQGNELAVGQEGDIAVRVKPNRPVGLFKEYWKDPQRTANSYREDWYITGDRATRDEDGYLWFVGRADDVIVSAGYRIGPFEVESALLEHEAVAESAVVASPDEVRGAVVKAFVVLKPGHRASDELARQLQETVKSATAPYKYPRKIEFVDSLPKTMSGKIRRAALREAEWQGT